MAHVFPDSLPDFRYVFAAVRRPAYIRQDNATLPLQANPGSSPPKEREQP
jgi:hypothetical protein